MVVGEKREIDSRPVFVKFGVGLAISLGGILFAFLRSRGIKTPPPEFPPSSDECESLIDSRGDGCYVLPEEDHAFEMERSDKNDTFPSSTKDPSSSGRCEGDKKGYTIQELVELNEECNLDLDLDYALPENHLETRARGLELCGKCTCAEHDELDREISRLKNQVNILEERERYLEIQLLEYYGLKEQETAVMELQNRLRISNMEAKLYNLKIESLESDNRRLEAQVVDYANVVAELEAAKAKIKLLRKKLGTEAEQNREQILSLQERVMKLRDEEKRVVDSNQTVEIERRKMTELEEELAEMKKNKCSLELENSELARKLECLQMVATSALDAKEEWEFKEENRSLQEQNKDLEKKVEQLQADRCTELEELVYLRWINACLRYELRDYQPSPGKAVARDLSKTLSPKSEERAKQLILEYANNEGHDDKTKAENDHWTTFQASVTDSSEAKFSSRMKVFAKLIRLLRGYDHDSDDQHFQTSPCSPMEEAVSVDDVFLGSYSSDSYSVTSDGLIKMLQASPPSDLKNTFTGESSSSSRRGSEDGFLNVFTTLDSVIKDANDLSPEIQPYQDAQNTAKTQLAKYAEALKKSSLRSSLHRRSARFNSF